MFQISQKTEIQRRLTVLLKAHSSTDKSCYENKTTKSAIERGMGGEGEM
jgi:hypothetical protein